MSKPPRENKKRNQPQGPFTSEMVTELLDLLVQLGSDLTHPAVPILREILNLDGEADDHAPLEKVFVARSLRSLWDARYKPKKIRVANVAAWSKYITLIAVYLYPASQRLEPPSSLNAIGDLLADEEYLALVIADGDTELAKKIRMTNHDFWRTFILPEDSPRDKTGHARLKTAIERLTDLLNEHYEALSSHPLPDLPTESEASSLTPSLAATVSPFDPAMEPTQIRAWLEARFASATPELRETARTLAQRLAAIRLGIIPSEVSAILTRPQVMRAFADRDNPTLEWKAMDFLERAAILEYQLGDHWEFAVAPTAVELLVAEYVTDYQPSWVSLRCANRGVMDWIMVILTERADTQRLKQFLDQLGQAMNYVSLLSVLEWAHYLGKVESLSLPGVAEYLQRASEALCRLSHMNQKGLARLQRSICEARRDLHLAEVETEPVQRAELCLERIDLDRLSPGADLATCLHILRATAPRAPEQAWLENGQVLRALITGLQAGAIVQTQIECAVWLRRSSLSPRVGFETPRWAVWEARSISAAESVAQIALDASQRSLVRSLAFSVLLREEVLLDLWEKEYRALVYEASLALNKRLFCMPSDSEVWHFV